MYDSVTVACPSKLLNMTVTATSVQNDSTTDMEAMLTAVSLMTIRRIRLRPMRS